MRSSLVMAAGVDPAIGTAISGAFGDFQSLILTVLAVAFFGLIVAVTAIKVGAKWATRAANK